MPCRNQIEAWPLGAFRRMPRAKKENSRRDRRPQCETRPLDFRVVFSNARVRQTDAARSLRFRFLRCGPLGRAKVRVRKLKQTTRGLLRRLVSRQENLQSVESAECQAAMDICERLQRSARRSSRTR